MAITFAGLAILIGTLSISVSLDKLKSASRYEFIAVGEEFLILFDKKTGRYWQKRIGDGESAEWQQKKTPPSEQDLK